MLHTMRRLTCISIALLAIPAAAQQTAPPVSIGIVLDTSGSMGAKIARSRQVAAQFLNSANSQDEFFLIEAANRPVLASAFTTDPYRMLDRLAFIQSKGRSALWDSAGFAMTEMKNARNPRKALILISDGGDNASQDTPARVAELARDSDVPIYVFGVHDPVSQARTAEELDGPAKLKDIADQSRGRYFAVENLNDIPIFTSQVTSQIRSAVANSR
jgi:Ca-activated chloride channel family protein